MQGNDIDTLSDLNREKNPLLKLCYQRHIVSYDDHNDDASSLTHPLLSARPS